MGFHTQKSYLYKFLNFNTWNINMTGVQFIKYRNNNNNNNDRLTAFDPGQPG